MATKIVKILKFPDSSSDSYQINAVALDGVSIDQIKRVQSPITSPSVNGTTNTCIDTISQDNQGVITATKKTIVITSDNMSDDEIWHFDCGTATTVLS